MKRTYQDAILSVCKNQHYTVDEIYDIMKKKFPSLGIATVYRNVKALVEEGSLSQITGVWSAIKYETYSHDHMHVIDKESEKIMDIDIPSEFLEKLESYIGRKIESVDMKVFVRHDD